MLLRLTLACSIHCLIPFQYYQSLHTIIKSCVSRVKLKQPNLNKPVDVILFKTIQHGSVCLFYYDITMAIALQIGQGDTTVPSISCDIDLTELLRGLQNGRDMTVEICNIGNP